MKERGIATKVDGSAVTVLIKLSEGCASCNSKETCGVVGRELDAEAAPGTSIAVGDAVELEVANSASAAGALWLLVVPLGLFFVGYLGAGALWPSRGEGLSALVGLGGVALGLLLAATVARRGHMARRPKATPLPSIFGDLE
ncbi:MAG: hypothetical protein A2Y38_18895 [Spirochaetes bacterium GWB1_59_5]|nr:MAG: hypothetical protein A2Y38_18895 [Spirochaetes bacterium GWB1_59_5]